MSLNRIRPRPRQLVPAGPPAPPARSQSPSPVARPKPAKAAERSSCAFTVTGKIALHNPGQPASPETLKLLEQLQGRSTAEERARVALGDPGTATVMHPENGPPLVMEGRGSLTVFCTPEFARECGR